MNNDIWIFGAVCYIGGICTVLLPLLAPKVVSWWAAYLDRHQFPQFPLGASSGSVEEYQRELRVTKKRDLWPPHIDNKEIGAYPIVATGSIWSDGVKGDTRGFTFFPPECVHQSPPCQECHFSGAVWSQFDADNGSARRDLHPTDRDAA